jgi:hypothetical protein
MTSTDGHFWIEVCTCDPDWAHDIAYALQLVEKEENDQYGING